MDPELIGPDEVARMLGVTTGTVRRLRQSGELRGVRLGYRTIRYYRADVRRLVARRTQRPPMRVSRKWR